MKLSTISGKATPKRRGLEYEVPDEALKKSIRDDVGTVMLNLQRDVTQNEDRNDLVTKVVQLCATTDPQWNALKDLPVCPIITYIRSSI